MMQTRIERLELKTLVDERTACAIRSDVLPFCQPDVHNAPEEGGSYSITSLYLDTAALAFYRAERRSEPFRLKLRVRTYGPDGPVHLEIKRRLLGVVDKMRLTVAREGWRRAAASVAGTLAEPSLLVRYEREAYASTDHGGTRVTFDRRVEVQRAVDWDLEGDPGAWRPLLGPRWPVLLELKCGTTVPEWMSALVRRHHLSMQRFSKYARGIAVTPGLGGLAAAPDAPALAPQGFDRGQWMEG